MTSFESAYLAKRNRDFLWMLAGHVPAAAVIAKCFGTGVATSTALALGILAGPMLMLALGTRGRFLSHVIAVAAMSFSALLIHAAGGMIEFHFHIFVMLALMITFGNPWVVVTAAATVAVQHLALYFLLPRSVFNYQASLDIVALHAGFVVFEAVPAAMIAAKFGSLVFVRAQAIVEAAVLLEAVGSGDFTGQVKVASKDEVGRLGNALNRTVVALRDARDAMESVNERERAAGAARMADVRVILDVVTAAGRGDLTRTIGLPGDDEIAQVGRGLDGFFATLRESIAGIASNAQELAANSGSLQSVSVQMTRNAGETSDQANAASASAEQVSRSVQIAASAIEQMGAAIGEISRGATGAAQAATKAVGVASRADEMVKRLGDGSKEIEGVVAFIGGIARQTNLLALNATIEAARAGEAGRGFAVVADEVKKLAQETANATANIGSRIAALRKDTDGAIAAIHEISGVIVQVNDLSNTIASAVEEQTATTGEMGRSLGEASRGTADIARSIAGVAQAAKDTTGCSSDCQSAAGGVTRMAEDLDRLVAKFTYAKPAEPKLKAA